MNRHEDLEWAQVQGKLEGSAERLWSLNEMEQTGGEPDLVGYDPRTYEYISTIVQRKVRMAGEACATTAKRWRQGKNINREIAQLGWQLQWVSSS